MLKVKCFQSDSFGENAYVAWDETHEAMIVDCGCISEEDWRPLKTFVESEQLVPKRLICTHGHFDHTLGNRFAMRDFGLLPEMHEADVPLYRMMPTQLMFFLGPQVSSSTDCSFTEKIHPNALSEGQKIEFGNQTFTVLETPGHTEGGVCLYCPENQLIFTGDTLFCGSIGRTDLPGGSYEQILESLKRLAALPPETTVFSGHGPATNIDNELQNNPYL